MLDKNKVHAPAAFILGGNAEFTVRNCVSKAEFKYKVRVSKKDKTLFFVSVKEGDGYEYAGCLRKFPTRVTYFQGKKGSRSEFDPAIKGVMYALRFAKVALPYPMEMNHHGRCACCGRKLDDDESVARGFGPVCWERYRKEVG